MRLHFTAASDRQAHDGEKQFPAVHEFTPAWNPSYQRQNHDRSMNTTCSYYRLKAWDNNNQEILLFLDNSAQM